MVKKWGSPHRHPRYCSSEGAGGMAVAGRGCVGPWVKMGIVCCVLRKDLELTWMHTRLETGGRKSLALTSVEISSMPDGSHAASAVTAAPHSDSLV